MIENMNIKRMSRYEWTQITEKKQIIRAYSKDGKNGKVSLLRIDDVREPFVTLNRNEEPVKLADRNYTWVQLAMENDFAWFTVMFDDQNRFLQIYIDVTAGNHTECEDPWFEDLYLDYVIDEKTVLKLDEKELEDAYVQQKIPLQQYALCLQHGRMIEAYLCGHYKELIAFFADLQKELKAEMDQTD